MEGKKARLSTPVASIFFLLLTLFITYPLLKDFKGSVPGMEEGDVWDHIFNHHHIRTNFRDVLRFDFYNPGLAYPSGIYLYLVDLLNGLLSATLLRPLDLIFTFNLLLLFNLMASPFALFFLIRYLTGSFAAGLVGGTAIGFSPYILAEVNNGVPESITNAFLPLFALFLIKYWKEGKKGPFFLAILFFFMNSVNSWYHLLAGISLFFVLFIFRILEGGWGTLRVIYRPLIALSAGGLLIAPFIRAFLLSLEDPLYSLKGSEKVSERLENPFFSASIRDIFYPSRRWRPGVLSEDGHFELYLPSSIRRYWVFGIEDRGGKGIDGRDLLLTPPSLPLTPFWGDIDGLLLSHWGGRKVADFSTSLPVSGEVISKVKGEVSVYVMKEEYRLPGMDPTFATFRTEAPGRFSINLPSIPATLFFHSTLFPEDEGSTPPLYGLERVSLRGEPLKDLKLYLKGRGGTGGKERRRLHVEGMVRFDNWRGEKIQVEFFTRESPSPLKSLRLRAPGGFETGLTLPEGSDRLWVYAYAIKGGAAPVKVAQAPSSDNPLMITATTGSVKGVDITLQKTGGGGGLPLKRIRVRGKIEPRGDGKGGVVLATTEPFIRRDYTVASTGSSQGRYTHISYVSKTVLFLSLLGLILRFRSTFPFFLGGAGFLLLSMGNFLCIDERAFLYHGSPLPMPMKFLVKLVPVLSRMEFVYRLHHYALFYFSIAASWFLSLLPKGRIRGGWEIPAGILLSLFIFGEYLILSPYPDLKTSPLPDASHCKAVRETCRGGVLDLPSGMMGEIDGRYLYFQMFHDRPITYDVNQLNPSIAEKTSFQAIEMGAFTNLMEPGEEAAFLLDKGVDCIVLHRESYPALPFSTVKGRLEEAGCPSIEVGGKELFDLKGCKYRSAR